MSKMLGVKQVAEMLNVSEGKAYEYIRTMNAELAQNGYLTVRGKCPQAYIEKRFFGFSGGENGVGA